LSFPDPRKGEYLHAPFGPGLYELRNKATGELVLFGSGKNVACRMSSLLPAPLGQGVRKNNEKREYVLQTLRHIEYHTKACKSVEEAKGEENHLKDEDDYLFGS
jgi:hypothetical protein